VGSVYEDPELQPLPDRAAALAAYEHLVHYMKQTDGVSQSEKSMRAEALKELTDVRKSFFRLMDPIRRGG
jgi:hypothetical protein